MLISDLIKELQELRTQRGEIEVVIYDGSDIDCPMPEYNDDDGDAKIVFALA